MSTPSSRQTVEEILLAIPNAKRVYRDEAAQKIEQDSSFSKPLFDIVFEGSKRINILAAWVFELVYLNNFSLLIPHLEQFINQLQGVKHESQLRPISKICNQVVLSNYESDKYQIKLNSAQKEQLVEVNFDWLIGNHKIATKAYAMDTLFLLGKEIDWVYPELIQILQQQIHQESAGYKVRARRILNQLGN